MKKDQWENSIEIDYPQSVKEACQKQIALLCEETKEIMYAAMHNERYEIFKHQCPNCCTKTISRFSMLGDKYCRECGQRINMTAFYK
jgi:ribosomal protein L33